jgi:two-component system, OmpR family, sensor histidine kinase KdpD
MQSESFKPNSSDTKKMLVAVNHTRQSLLLLEKAYSFAKETSTELLAVYVENADHLSKNQQTQLDRNLIRAKELGVVLRIVTNYDLVKGIIAFAFNENVTHIIVGKPKSKNLFTRLRTGDFIDKLLQYSGDIHVIVLSDSVNPTEKFREKLQFPSFTSGWHEYLISVLVIFLTALGCYHLQDWAGYRIFSFVLLFAVSILAFIYGTGPVLLASTLSALIWNFFFIPPHFTFHINDTEDMLMFVMFFIIALLNGVLTSRIRSQESNIRKREERTYALYNLTRELSEATDIASVKDTAITGIKKYFGSDAAVYLEDELDGKPQFYLSKEEQEAIMYCFTHSERGGKYQKIFSGSKYSYFPMIGNKMKTGMIVTELNRKFTFGEEQFWDAYTGQIAAKLEREILRLTAQKALLLDESDKLYKTLFNSISHEFRIPVTAIMGATDTLLTEKYPEDVQQKLIREINIASIRLNQLIENLLNMSRLESGHLSLRKDWYDVHDLINKVTHTLREELSPYVVATEIEEDLPLILFDFGLMEQVIHNLLLNATQYTPVGSEIKISIGLQENTLEIVITDSGKGFQENELNNIFDKFFRGKSSRTGGTGLGLSIAKGFIEAHKGAVSVSNRPEGGAAFTIKLPIND